MRTWARFVMLVLVLGVSLAPPAARALVAVSAQRAVPADDCCPDSDEHAADADDEGACSPLCASSCCPQRTAGAPEIRQASTVAREVPLPARAELAELPPGRSRAIEYPPSLH